MCAQLRVWQRTEPEQWQGRDRDLLPPTDPAHKRWRWLHWSAHLYPALTGDTRAQVWPSGERWHQAVVTRQHPEYHPRWWGGGKWKNDASLIMVTVGAWMKGVRELRYVTKLTTDHQDTSDLDPSHVATWGPIIYHTQLIPDTSPDHRAEATSNPSQVRGNLSCVLVYLNIEENTFSDSE